MIQRFSFDELGKVPVGSIPTCSKGELRGDSGFRSPAGVYVREALNEASKLGAEFKEASDIALGTWKRKFVDSLEVVGIKLYSDSVSDVAKDFDVVASETTFFTVQLQARFPENEKNSEKAMETAFDGARKTITSSR